MFTFNAPMCSRFRSNVLTTHVPAFSSLKKYICMDICSIFYITLFIYLCKSEIKQLLTLLRFFLVYFDFIKLDMFGVKFVTESLQETI